MIDPKELRIGNYVRSLKNNSNLCFGGNLPFWEVTIDDILHILNNPKNYEPIPLTEDWLVKFGFEVTDDNPKQKSYYEGDILFDMVCFKFSNSEKKGSNGGFYCYEINDGNTYINSVHQIQNLYFALTGQELIYNENHK